MSLKKTIALTLISVMTLSLGACSKTSGNEVKESSEGAAKLIESAIESVKDIEGYQGETNLYFDFENTTGVMQANVKTDVYVYAKDNRRIKISTDLNGEQAGQSEFYVQAPELVGADKTIYMIYEGEWFKSAADDDTLYYLLGQYDIPEVIRVLLTAASVAEEKGQESIEGVKATRVDAIIDEDVIANTLIYSGVFIATGMNTLTETHLAGAKAMPISFWFDDEGRVVKVEFDAGGAYQTISDNLFETVKDLEGYEDAQKLVINTYSIEFLLAEINNTDELEFPEEVLGATLLQE